MKQRLEQFLLAENISKAQFADSIKVARAAISHIMSGRNNPSYEFIVNTMKAYPELNVEWLLNGTGKMYKTTPEPPYPASNGVLFPEVEGIKEIPQSQADVPNEAAAYHPQEKGTRKARKVTIFYDDGTYEEFC